MKVYKNADDECRCSVVLPVHCIPNYQPKRTIGGYPVEKTAYCPNTAEYEMSCEGITSWICSEHRKELDYPRFNLHGDAVLTPRFRQLSGWLF